MRMKIISLPLWKCGYRIFVLFFFPQKVSIFNFWKIMFWKLFFLFFPLEIHCWGVSRGQKYSSTQFLLKGKGCIGFWIFNDQIDGISSFRSLKNQPDRWNSIILVPKKLVIIQFHWPGPIRPADEHINNYVLQK